MLTDVRYRFRLMKKIQLQAGTASAAANGKGFIAYTVKSGDSLYSIAKKYPGVSTKDLQQVNGLNGSNIRPGQVLKIPIG